MPSETAGASADGREAVSWADYAIGKRIAFLVIADLNRRLLVAPNCHHSR